MRSLPILWQRLVNAKGQTCDRCAGTQDEMLEAVETLKQVLAPLGIEPQLEIAEVDDDTFRQSPGESNRIWIADEPMENWLDASVGSSRCCSVCGESECRTIEVRGTTFEAIPQRLIIQAALVASADLLNEVEATSAEQAAPR